MSEKKTIRKRAKRSEPLGLCPECMKECLTNKLSSGLLVVAYHTHARGMVIEPCPGVGQAPHRVCRECGCTDLDCQGCIEKTGSPCHWVEPDLCSARVGGQRA